MSDGNKSGDRVDHLSVAYAVENRPFTTYPAKMARHLTERFGLATKGRLLEIGCGRGEFLKGFKQAGLEVMGVDMCRSALDFSPDLDIRVCMLGQEPMPFEDGFFGVVYSKSVIEHIADPAVYMKEALRVLRPGGLLITMTPDWESCHELFYDEFTHVRPYTVNGLKLLYGDYRLGDIMVEKFYQLPIVWQYPWLKYICRIIAPFVPIRTKAKFPRWSRELMLLGIGAK